MWAVEVQQQHGNLRGHLKPVKMHVGKRRNICPTIEYNFSQNRHRYEIKTI
jgi:hypothetical protein